MQTHAKNAREKLLKRMDNHSVALLFAGKPPHKSLDQYYDYMPQRNFFYLTNLSEPNMILMLLKGDKTSKEFLFIEENTDHKIKWEGASMEKDEAAKRSLIDEGSIYTLGQFDGMFNQMMNYARSILGQPAKTLYLDLYHPSLSAKPMSLVQAKTIIENYPELNVKSLNEHLAYLRMFKSDAELKQIKKAIGHTKAGLTNILKSLKHRNYEYQLQADFLHAITLSGSEGNAFDTIAASGQNATILHYTKNQGALNKDDLILFDLGALHENYASDISRTYPLSGTYKGRQKEIYEAVLEVNKATIEMVKPGVTWKALNAFSKNMLATKAKALKLIDDEKDIMSVYYHSIGHFMGLDVHDVGLYDMPLEAGMVVTIEPGLYVKDENIGVRIEDDILVTENGYENLSKDIPKETKDIEKILKGS